MYKLIKLGVVLRLEDNVELSTSAIEYYNWVSAGNQPTYPDLIVNPKITEIHNQLKELDIRSIRPIRDNELDRLKVLTEEAVILRSKLQELPLMVLPPPFTEHEAVQLPLLEIVNGN